jgi:hypothetical protein
VDNVKMGVRKKGVRLWIYQAEGSLMTSLMNILIYPGFSLKVGNFSTGHCLLPKEGPALSSYLLLAVQ